MRKKQHEAQLRLQQEQAAEEEFQRKKQIAIERENQERIEEERRINL